MFKIYNYKKNQENIMLKKLKDADDDQIQPIKNDIKQISLNKNKIIYFASFTMSKDSKFFQNI